MITQPNLSLNFAHPTYTRPQQEQHQQQQLPQEASDEHISKQPRAPEKWIIFF